MASSEARWHEGAIEDALSARDWYARRSANVARGFLRSLEAAITAVAESPRRWPKATYGCQRYVFPSSYPFSLVYRLPDDQSVQIVAVVHQKRHPAY